MSEPTQTKQASDPPADTASQAVAATAADPVLTRVVGEEERVLGRVRHSIQARREQAKRQGPTIDYDAELISLRDQILEARAEDIPPLVEEMERISQVAKRRSKIVAEHVDPNSPYFGHLVLEEGERKREVLIGRSTYLDSRTGIRIVDWRDAPVSRIYYRYDEGDDYEEHFGGRDVEGEVITRRNVVIAKGELRRIGSPEGTFLCGRDGTWRSIDTGGKLEGGQGAALRAEDHKNLGKLGVGGGEGREDKHLAEITALIDPRQFELITKPNSGLVVIQGGAGSGKSTIGLHRMAYLAFQDKRRFRPDKMIILVFNDALARYISKVLPALGVSGTRVATYEKWAEGQRKTAIRDLPDIYDEDSPVVVIRLKKHPVMLEMIREYGKALGKRLDEAVTEAGSQVEGGGRILKQWRQSKGMPAATRANRLNMWMGDKRDGGGDLPLQSRHAVERAMETFRHDMRDIPGAWADLLTDIDRIKAAFDKHAPGAMSEAELEEAVRYTKRRCDMILDYRDAKEAEVSDGPRGDHNRGVDGREEELAIPSMDREDDTILLALHQHIRGRLRRKREVLEYSHIFVDEAQDLSPVEMSVVLDTAGANKSVTLAGDTAQRLHMHNGFSHWREVLSQLGFDGVDLEPLKLAYRSTHPIYEFASAVLGPLKPEDGGQATRGGAPVEFFQFEHTGDAVALLGENLRALMAAEPAASVAVIARYPEQADMYYRGLKRAEVPHLRRIADQDFPFKAGIDVTDVRQVKGLEFDYVVLVETSAASYPGTDEARHLLHIAATRAAHQLWVTSTGHPSTILPEKLRERGY